MPWIHKCGQTKPHHSNEGVEWGDGFALVGPSKCKFTGTYTKIENAPRIVKYPDGMQFITGALVELQIEIERDEMFPPIIGRAAWEASK